MQPAPALSVLQTPDLTLLGQFWGVLADIGRVLTDEAREACPSCSAIGHFLDERGPGADPREWPLARVAPGMTPADVAGMIGGILAWRPGPATAVFAGLTGREITVNVTGVIDIPQRYARDGILMAGDLPCAVVGLGLDPELIPPAAMGRIRSGEPCGAVLEGYGLTRLHRTVRAGPGCTVRSRAGLALCGVRVGAAAEMVTPELCAHLAVTAA